MSDPHVQQTQTHKRGESSSPLTECHAQDPITRWVLRPSDHSLELESPLVSLAHRTLQRRHTYCPITYFLSVCIYDFPGHIKGMNRIRLTPNFEGHVDLSRAINDIDIPTKGRDIAQLGALSARVDRIHNIPVGRPTL